TATPSSSGPAAYSPLSPRGMPSKPQSSPAAYQSKSPRSPAPAHPVFPSAIALHRQPQFLRAPPVSPRSSAPSAPLQTRSPPVPRRFFRRSPVAAAIVRLPSASAAAALPLSPPAAPLNAARTTRARAPHAGLRSTIRRRSPPQ